MSSENELPLLIRNSVQWMYSNADSELLQRCEAAQRHYASSTAVTMLLLGSYCCVAHLVKTLMLDPTVITVSVVFCLGG